MTHTRFESFTMTCSWCGEGNEYLVRPLYCWNCGHRADLARTVCDCIVCRERRHKQEEREREKHDD
jgi:hypothetical protein